MGNRVNEILSRFNKSQSWLAEQWDISRSAVSAQLNRPTLSSEKLILLARALSVPIIIFFPKDVWPAGTYDVGELMRLEDEGVDERLRNAKILVQEQRMLLEVKEESNAVLRETIKELEEKITRLENK
jgi:hypothetical protein